MPEGIPRVKQGWLVKQGGRVKNWKRRFFVLDGSKRLAYYVSEADAQAGVHQLGIIDMQKALYVTPRAAANLKDTTTFWPSHVSPDSCFTIIIQERNYHIYSDISAEDAQGWMKELQKVRGEAEAAADGAAGRMRLSSSAMRPRANTVNTLQLDSHQLALVERYNMADMPPKVVGVFCKWHRLLETTLANMGKQFGTAPYTFQCDMGEMFDRAPKLRTRLGELVFGDYVDELRYNLTKTMGDDDVGREAFVKATFKKHIRFGFVDNLPGSTPNRVSVVDGALVIEVDTNRLGKGVHLVGKNLIDHFSALSEEPVCGGVLKGLPLADAMNVCRARAALDQALTRLGRALQTDTFRFVCNYRAIHKAAAADHKEVQHLMGDTIVRNIVSECCSLLAGHAYSGKGDNLQAKLESLLSRRKIAFELGESNTVTADVNEDGVLVVTTNLDKVRELAVYDRTAVFDMKSLLEQAANVGTSI